MIEMASAPDVRRFLYEQIQLVEKLIRSIIFQLFAVTQTHERRESVL